METTAARKSATFRLNAALLERVKAEAARENRSLNNFVETLLMEAMRRIPNPETAEAIEEARSGKFAGELDMDNFESFMKSLNSIS